MVTTQVYSTWTLTWKGYNCRGFSVRCHPKCSPVSFQPHFQQEVVWGHRLVTRCPGPGMPVQSPQTTLSLTTGCVLSVAAGTRPQLWINKEWQQRGLPAFIASASSEWMDMGDLILGGSERSAPSCATCLPHCLPSACSHSTHTARLHKTTFVKKSFLQVFVREVATKWPSMIKLKRKQNKREIQLLTSNVNNWLQKSSWKDGSSDKVSYSLGWKQSFLRFKITGLLFLHVRTYELKVESFTKAYPSLSPLPQWWPMALYFAKRT